MEEEVPVPFYLSSILWIEVDTVSVKCECREAEQKRLGWGHCNTEIRCVSSCVGYQSHIADGKEEETHVSVSSPA